jgi:hypothetical protein
MAVLNQLVPEVSSPNRHISNEEIQTVDYMTKIAASVRKFFVYDPLTDSSGNTEKTEKSWDKIVRYFRYKSDEMKRLVHNVTSFILPQNIAILETVFASCDLKVPHYSFINSFIPQLIFSFALFLVMYRYCRSGEWRTL